MCLTDFAREIEFARACLRFALPNARTSRCSIVCASFASAQPPHPPRANTRLRGPFEAVRKTRGTRSRMNSTDLSAVPSDVLTHQLDALVQSERGNIVEQLWHL